MQGWHLARWQSFVLVLESEQNLRQNSKLVLGSGKSLKLVLGLAQRLVLELVVEAEEREAEEIEKGKYWLSAFFNGISILQPAISTVKYGPTINDQPVGQVKVLDLVQCQRWSAGGLECLAAMLKRVLSPAMRI